MDTALYTGLGLCAVAGLRCAAAVARWAGEKRRERREFLDSLRQFEQQLEQQRPTPPSRSEAWKGYRRFVVERTVAEADDITSIYLSPEDRRPLPAFRPGQFLTLRIQVPGQNKAAVRCYSLSDRPRADYYRITVKAVRPEAPTTRQQGLVSRYLSRGVRTGDVFESQAPRGEFHLLDDARPAVLIGAGIGITPLLSMTSTLLHQPGDRQVILFHGVRNSREHAFRDRLQNLASLQSRMRYLPCYSQPLPMDQPERGYVVPGRIDIDLVRRVLPSPNVPCYVCGPGEFMESMVDGLRAWGVAEQDLHFEAFGPSTVKRAAAISSESASGPAVTARVSFQQSDVEANFSSASSLLDLAEANGVSVPSGCRAGNCGLCATRLLAGQVRYPQPPTAPIDPGFCLTCVAQPDSAEVVIDA
jgi:uncharacterized protein